jgi:signal peptidase I
MRPKEYRTSRATRHWNALTRAFVWVFLVIFVLTSVGVTLFVVSSGR